MGACASVPKSMRDQDADLPAPKPVKEEAVAAEQTPKEQNKAEGEQESLGSLLDQPEPNETEKEEETLAGQPKPEETVEKEERPAVQLEPEKTEENEEKPAVQPEPKKTDEREEILKPAAVEVEKPAAVEVEKPAAVEVEKLSQVVAAVPKKEEPEIEVAPKGVAAAEPEKIVVSVEKKTEEQNGKN